MVEELEIAHFGVKVDGMWCGHYSMLVTFIFLVDRSRAARDVDKGMR